MEKASPFVMLFLWNEEWQFTEYKPSFLTAPQTGAQKIPAK